MVRSGYHKLGAGMTREEAIKIATLEFDALSDRINELPDLKRELHGKSMLQIGFALARSINRRADELMEEANAMPKS